MVETWKHKVTIWSGVLLGDEETTLNLQSEVDEPQPAISFAAPKRLEKPVWSTWDNAMPITAWEYEVTLLFKAENDDLAQQMAIQKVDSLVARLSFFSSAPVKATSYGSLSNAPDEPVPGTQYKSINFAAEQAIETAPLTIGEEKLQHLASLLLAAKYQVDGKERIERSMRWLEHSRLARTLTDEFTCLLIAFENLGNLLEAPVERFWHCSSCDKEMTECPHCGKSTARKGSAYLAMKNFVDTNLNWPSGRWQEVWKLRNKTLHGSGDLTMDDQRVIIQYLPDLEAAVINAIRHLLHLPHNSPPNHLRMRMPFHYASLKMEWMLPEQG